MARACRQIALFGGSFNPVHNGHLILALEILEKHSLDEVWFCPANINPHKSDLKVEAAQHRLRMLELATENIPQFKVLDLELRRSPPSYTIDTIEYLLEKESKKTNPSNFHLLISDELLYSLANWKRIDEIIDLVPLLIGTRDKIADLDFIKDPRLRAAVQEGVTSTRCMEISSTEIRHRLRDGLCCIPYIPKNVLDYIGLHRLYCYSDEESDNTKGNY